MIVSVHLTIVLVALGFALGAAVGVVIGRGDEK